MRINVNIVYISVLVGIISFILALLSNNQSILYNISLNLLAGAIFAIVTALVNYFNEKHKMLNEIKVNISNWYLNLNVIDQIMCNVLPQIMTVTYLDNLDFRHMKSIAELNMINTHKADFDYYEFLNNSKPDHIYNIEKYSTDLYNLRHNLDKLELLVLNHDVAQRQREIKQLNNVTIMPEEDRLIFEKRNIVNVRSAKIHEYNRSLILKLDDIANVYYNKKNESWMDVKKLLDEQVVNIIEEKI